MKSMFGNYKEKDVMKVQTNLTRKPIVSFDKDTQIKVLAWSGEFKVYEIDNERGEFVERQHKINVLE